MTTPNAAAAMERLETKWREAIEANRRKLFRTESECVMCNTLDQCADELATLRAGIAQQGEGKPVAWEFVGTVKVPVGQRARRVDDHPMSPPVVTEYETRYRWRATVLAETKEQKPPVFTHPAAVDEAVAITLDRYAKNSADWNGCHGQAIKALRYLGDHGQCPQGGEQFPNAACCYMLADELERSFKSITAALLPATSEGS